MRVSRKSAWRTVAEPLIAQLSFLVHLKGQLLVWLGLNSFGMSLHFDLFTERQRDPSDKNHVFFHYILSICEKKRSIYWNNFNGQELGNLVWASNDTKMSRPTSSSFGVKSVKNCYNSKTAALICMCYTVEKGITRSILRLFCFADRRNEHPASMSLCNICASCLTYR